MFSSCVFSFYQIVCLLRAGPHPVSLCIPGTSTAQHIAIFCKCLLNALIHACSKKQTDPDFLSFCCCVFEAEKTSVRGQELCGCCHLPSLHLTTSPWWVGDKQLAPTPLRTAAWGGALLLQFEWWKEGQVAGWEECYECTEEHGEGLAVGEGGFRRGGFEEVSLIHFQLWHIPMHMHMTGYF